MRRYWTALSNLAYPLAAIAVGEAVFFLLMLGLGIASAIYHWNHERNADWDVGMIFVILLFLIGSAWGVSPLAAVLPSLAGGYALRMHVPYMNMELKIGVLIGPLFIFGFLTGASLLASVGVLAGALAIRQWVNHGAWHLASALGLALVAQALL